MEAINRPCATFMRAVQINYNTMLQVEEIEHFYIPLSDGIKLAARAWMPHDASSNPLPAILEYLPYRKRDGTAIRDALTHPYFAAHGYAYVRVDIRGYGESDGLINDEYVVQEQDDGLQVIDWITKQPWCDGNVGMMGISWGGFNGLQIAARQPQALKAIITLCSTDDRYADDIHYKGGAMLMENIGWAATMLSYSTAPPDPLLVGDEWFDTWKNRLENMPLLVAKWMRHQSRDELWQHGSICEDYSSIKAAVYCMTGWADAYTNSIPRMMEHLQCPKKALVGPWLHKYPHFARPEPRIGFLQEALRWWDYWLKGIDTGIMDEPSCTFYLQDSVEPKPSYDFRAGQWIQTDHWPDENKISMDQWSLTHNGLSSSIKKLGSQMEIDSPLTTGVHGGEYIALWFGPDYPTDQRRDDALSVCFDSAILESDLKIVGNPKLKLKLSSNSTCGQLTVRLSDVAPNGKVTRVTYGTINLRNRDSLESTQEVVANKVYEIELQMDFIAQTIPKGHRMRVALSSSYFPLLWTTPEKSSVTLAPDQQSLMLPIFTGTQIPEPFEPPVSAEPEKVTMLREASNKRVISEDVATGVVRVDIEDDFGRTQFDRHGLWVDQVCHESYSAHPDDPDQTRAHTYWQHQTGRDDWQVSSETEISVTCDKDDFYIKAGFKAYQNDKLIYEKDWGETVPRIAV